MAISLISSRNKTAILFLTGALISSLALAFPDKNQSKKKKAEEQEKITEEIVVTGKAPKELPVATVTRLDFQKIEDLKPVDLSEAIKFAPGVMVTLGTKNEFTLKLRGMDSRRIVLLVDGIPVYEPYFGSFDLKTVVMAGVEALQITKGPSSTLYGPNTLAGIVNVITRRPTADPKLSLNAALGARNTSSLGGESSFQWRRLGFSGSFLCQNSDGFYYPDKDKPVERSLSDYGRMNFNLKAYYTPSRNTEIMVGGGFYRSHYGIPPAISFVKPRYWRFKNWDRYSLSAGGFAGIGRDSTLRFRVYYVGYYNVLDQFLDKETARLGAESTYDNSVYGVFAIGDFSLSQANALKISLHAQSDQARTQDNIGLPYQSYDQRTFSLGIEDHFSFYPKWKIIAGLSYDYLDKYLGKNTARINPLLGIKFSPSEEIDFHLSFSKKSKFPSMHSLYSTATGNPSLLSETGYCGEAGFTYDRGIMIAGSAFFYRFQNMIDTVRMADGRRQFFNIGKAYINGFEIQARKSLARMDMNLNYTYLDHKNQSDNRPLDALPAHNFNFDLAFAPFSPLRFNLYGLAASSSSWYDSSTKLLLNISSFFNLDATLSYNFPRFELYVKVTNLFDRFYYTEPGFPWRGRYIEIGVKWDVFRKPTTNSRSS